MISSFNAAQESIDWAKEALNTACIELKTFFEDEASASQVRYIDSETGEQAFAFRFHKRIPSSVTRGFSEAIMHARHSFDQSLYAACAAIGKRPRRTIYYPWAETPVDLERRLYNQKTGNDTIPPEFREVIRSHEPYKTGETYPGGNDMIRAVAAYANSKHTIGLNICGVIPSLKPRGYICGGKDGFVKIPAPVWDKSKNEIVIIRCSWNAEIDYEYEIGFNVIFDVPPPINTVVAEDAASIFIYRAQTVLDTLKDRALEVISARATP